MVMLLTTSGFVAVEAQAQTRAGESELLSAGVRAALMRTGGGTVLSAERIYSGSNGMSRVKIVDPRGRMQVIVIDDSPRMSRGSSPFEPEEGRRGRFARPSTDMPVLRTGVRKPRSSDVEN